MLIRQKHALSKYDPLCMHLLARCLMNRSGKLSLLKLRSLKSLVGLDLSSPNHKSQVANDFQNRKLRSADRKNAALILHTRTLCRRFLGVSFGREFFGGDLKPWKRRPKLRGTK